MNAKDVVTDDSESNTQPERGKIVMDDITKHFGRVVAIDSVSLEVRENEIFALIGDNGAGKSTLMNILSGRHQPTSGQIYYNGREMDFSNPGDAREQGIETVYQDLALMNDLDVARNIYLGNFPHRGIGPLDIIDWNLVYKETERIMSEILNQDLDIEAEVSFLSGGQRQLVAIGRAIAFEPDVLILDEPTSALSIDATALVHETVERVKQEGYTQIIISHNIDEVVEIADRIGVLHQGAIADIVKPNEIDREDLNSLIIDGQY